MNRFGRVLKQSPWIFNQDSFQVLKVNPSSRNWLDTCDLPSVDRQERYWALHPVTLFEKRGPISIATPPQTAFEWCKKWRNNPTFVIKLPNAKFLRTDATLITHDGWILGDISQQWPFNVPFDQNNAQKQILFPKREHFKGVGLLLSTLFAVNNYYHWMMDLMPRLRLFQMAGLSFDEIDHFFVNSTKLPFQRETLKLAGIPASKIVETETVEYFSCDELYVPSMPNRIGFPRRWMTDYLESIVPKNASATPDKIYIDRRDSKVRVMLNNDVFAKFLEDLGFKLLVPSEQTFQETVSWFRGAKMIVAIHGAALTDLAFCAPGTHVLEICPYNSDNNGFWTLACEKELNYYFYRSTDPRTDDNFVFDPNTMGAAIRKWADGLA
jgi:hypothetical protein